MSENKTRDAWAEFARARNELGWAIADALRLREIVGWLNRRLTR